MNRVHSINTRIDENGFTILYSFGTNQSDIFSIAGSYNNVVTIYHLPHQYYEEWRSLELEGTSIDPKKEFNSVNAIQNDDGTYNIIFAIRSGCNFFESDFLEFNMTIFKKYDRKFIWSI